MIEVLGIEHLGLAESGPTLTLSIGKGQAIGIAGPAASGKSHLMSVLSGAERPVQGSVRRYGSLAMVEGASLFRRTRVQALLKKVGGFGNGKLADLLVATHLQDARSSLVSDLSPGQRAACELIGPLSSGADLILIDGQLDRLDPWVLRSTLNYLSQLRSEGTAFVVTTNRPDLIASFDALIVLRHGYVRFAGTVDDLLRIGPPHRLQVATENRPGVQSLVAPFEVSIEEAPDGVRMQAAEGQTLAARLLLEGYGDVKFVVTRPPTIEEALLSL